MLKEPAYYKYFDCLLGELEHSLVVTLRCVSLHYVMDNVSSPKYKLQGPRQEKTKAKQDCLSTF